MVTLFDANGSLLLHIQDRILHTDQGSGVGAGSWGLGLAGGSALWVGLGAGGWG